MRAAFFVTVFGMISVTAGPVAAQTYPETPPVGTLAQIMRGVYFPNSNLIFDVQMNDPAAPQERGDDSSVSNTFAGIYTGWQVVENAAIALAEGASLINKPGRLCENGRRAPVERYDWQRWSRELTDTAWEIYRAALDRNQELVAEMTNNLAEACDNCHRVYRSNAQENRLRCLGSGVVLPR